MSEHSLVNSLIVSDVDMAIVCACQEDLFVEAKAQEGHVYIVLLFVDLPCFLLLDVELIKNNAKVGA